MWPTFAAVAFVFLARLKLVTLAQEGAIQVARWAWPVLTASLVLSFPYSLLWISSILLTEATHGDGFALWITNAWRVFGWLIVFPLLQAVKGIVVVSPKSVQKPKLGLGGLLAFLTIADAGPFVFFAALTETRVICSAVSPIVPRKRQQANGESRLHSSYSNPMRTGPSLLGQ
jgi:hypothetical protein